MSWWPRRRRRIPHAPETPTAAPSPPDPDPHETPEGQRGRHWTELAYFGRELKRPWSSVHVGGCLRGTLEGEPGADPVPVTDAISIYHQRWFLYDVPQPPYRYVQRGNDESWAVCHVGWDENTGFCPGAVERRFEPGHKDLVLHHIRALWPTQFNLEYEEEYERRRQYWRDHEWF